LQADIRVVTLPAGMDPDEVVGRDPEEWRKIIAGARPVVEHVMLTLAAGRNLDDPKVKDEIAAQVLPLIEDVPSPIERDTFRQRLARLLRVDERVWQEISPKPSRSRPARRDTAESKPAAPQPEPMAGKALSSYALEVHCLGILLRRPDLLYQVDRRFKQEGLARLSAEDFEHADHKAIVCLFQDSVDQDMEEPQNFVFNNLSLPLMELADSLLAQTTQLDPNEERVLEDLMRGLLDLRRRKLHHEIEYQRYLIEDIQGQGDIQATQYLQNMVKLAEAKRRIDVAIKRYTSRSQSGLQEQTKKGI
jgi:DNA primase